MGILKSVLHDLWKRNARPFSVAKASSLITKKLRQQEGGSILCFTAGSEGNALTELIKGLMLPLRGMATRVELFDVNSANWLGDLDEVLREPVWFAASFFAIGQDVMTSRADKSVSLWEAGCIPFVRFFGDLPAYFPDRHFRRYRNSINGYFHQSHAGFHRRWFPDPALSVMLPPIMFDPMSLDKVDRQSKLTGKIIFPKNGNSPDRLIDYWRQALPPMLGKALENMAEESVGRDCIDREPCLDERLVKYFETIGLDITTERAGLCFLVAQLDDYIRRIKSTMIAESLLDLPVIVRGRYWDHVDFRGKRATHDPDSDMVRTLALIDHAPAIVDMSPNTQFAPHDRICRAVGRGTAFLTNRQEFLNSVLPSPERFSFTFERGVIRSCVERYVEHPEQAIELGIEQAMSMRKLFREEDFAQSLRTAVQLCALRLGERPTGTQNFVDFPPSLFH